MRSVSEAVYSFVRMAGERIGGFAFLLPAAAFALGIILFFVRLCLPSRRTFRFYTPLSDVLVLLFAAAVLAGSGDLLPSLALACAAKAVCVPLSALLGMPMRPRRREVTVYEEELPEEPAEPAPLRPAKVCCFDGEERVLVDRDVRLSHINALLERLRGMKLGAGDRLETEKAADLLSVYGGKVSLSAAEADALNDLMASLLKMLARYEA